MKKDTAKDLFEPLEKLHQPLAERLRPKRIEDVIGQDHVLSEGHLLYEAMQSKHLPSLIFWGPPGTGKTTLAKLLAEQAGYIFETMSAVQSGTADLKKMFEAIRARNISGKQTVLFIDEIHRFNRAQQDVLLPVVESGLFTLIGATTENPSFELNSALLSRAHVVVLKRLDDEALGVLIARAEKDVGRALPLTQDARERLVHMADGDGRSLLNMVEVLFMHNSSSRRGRLGGGHPRHNRKVLRKPALTPALSLWERE